MKKGMMILVIGMILVVAIIIGYTIFHKVKVNSDIKKSNIGLYGMMECVVECPQDSNCTCNDFKIPLQSSVDVDKYGDRLILGSDEFSHCNEVWANEKKLTSLTDCWRDVLPILKQRYNIEK